MKKEHKAAIFFTFSLGIVPALSCMIRFIVLTVETGQPNLVCKSGHYCNVWPGTHADSNPIDIMSMVEMATAIAAVSVPGLKPLLDRRDAGRRNAELAGEFKA